MSDKDEGFLNRVVSLTASELSRRIEAIRTYSTRPIGKVKLNPQQFRQKYGIGIREAQWIEKRHGPEVTQEILDGLGGKHAT